MSYIRAGNSTTTTLIQYGDTTGNLVFTTGGANTTALTLNNAQNAVFTNAVNLPNTFSYKNRFINGAMVIDQRYSGSSVTPTADGTYVLDRWQQLLTQSSKYSVQQNQGGVTPPAGFSNYLGMTSLSAYSVGATDYFAVGQLFEGFNVADLGWGTVNAKTITLSAWVYSSLTGTFGGVVKQYSNTRTYPFTYSIPVANTWTQISITVPGDTSGTYATNNAGSIKVFFGIGVGSTLSGTAGSWSGSSYLSATGATSVVGTNGATFYITGVQFEIGSQATSFDVRPYGTEFNLCQRYFQVFGGVNCYLGNGLMRDANNSDTYLKAWQVMRAAPSVSGSGGFGIFTNGDTSATYSGSNYGTQPQGSVVRFAAGSSLTSGQATIVSANNSSAYIWFSAEL